MQKTNINRQLACIIAFTGLFIASNITAAPAYLYYRAGKTVYVDDATEEPPGAGTSSGGPYITAATLVGDQLVERASGVNIELENNSRVTFDSTTHYLLQGVLANDTTLPYSATDTVNVAAGAAVNFVGGLNVLTRATILDGDQELIYNRVPSPDLTVDLKHGSEVVFEASTDTVKEGVLDGIQLLNYGASRTVYLQTDTKATFAGGFVSSGSLELQGAPFPYGDGLWVWLLEGELAEFEDSIVISGFLDGDQSITAIDDIDGFVVVKNETKITLSSAADGNVLTSGTVGDDSRLWHMSGFTGDVFMYDGDTFEVFPDTKRLKTATVSATQTLVYGPSRTVYAKGSGSTLDFDLSTGYVSECVSGGSQTLTSTGGPVGVSINDDLEFSGGYFVP